MELVRRHQGVEHRAADALPRARAARAAGAAAQAEAADAGQGRMQEGREPHVQGGLARRGLQGVLHLRATAARARTPLHGHAPTLLPVLTAPTCPCAQGCSKCHDETSYNCDECCDACDRVYSDTKKIYYCSPKKVDPLRDNLVEFL